MLYDIQNQVSKEQRKLSGALRQLQESHELADKQAMEIKKLKNALGVCACRSLHPTHYELLLFEIRPFIVLIHCTYAFIVEVELCSEPQEGLQILLVWVLSNVARIV